MRWVTVWVRQCADRIIGAWGIHPVRVVSRFISQERVHFTVPAQRPALGPHLPLQPGRGRRGRGPTHDSRATGLEPEQCKHPGWVLAGIGPAHPESFQNWSATPAPGRDIPRLRHGAASPGTARLPPDNDIGNSREEHVAQVMTDFGASPAQATTAATGRPAKKPAKGAKEWKTARTAGRK